DRDLDGGVGLHGLPQGLDDLLRQQDRQQPALERVAAEDVGEAGGQHGLEAVVLQCPHRVLTGRTRTEVRPGHQDGRPFVLGTVEHEVGVGLAPLGEQAVLATGTTDPLEVDGGDDLVGVDVALAQRHGPTGVDVELLHGSCLLTVTGCYWATRSAGGVSVPRTAVAAATSGETRWVRPTRPGRPSKLRLEVEALRSPGSSWSGFIPRHIEQPASRHSAPASSKIFPRPSSLACSLTRMEPGTTSMRTPSATLWPLMISAAARRSSIRPLVHEPRKTVSTSTSRMGVPASRSM